MTTATYYKMNLVLPIAVPLLTFGESYLRGGAQDTYFSVAYFLLGSVVFGGIPYLYIMHHLIREMGSGISPEEIQSQIDSAPLRMIPVCAVVWMAAAVVAGVGYGVSDGNISSFLTAIGWGIGGTIFLSIFVLLFGYAYVLLARLGLATLRAFNAITD